jgi:murein DD-endopeptidase MepM/ murein hydrolase activator NlpD
MWVGVDWENFVSRWREYSAAGLRLVDTASYPHACTSDCLNQVVMPEGSYNYMVSGDTETYRWPVDEVGTERFVRLPAIENVQPFLTLPFSDTAVNRGGIWRYDNGGWHHAGDYSRGDETFQILASADGEVIFVGWDNWSGNTVIVSHDVGGTADAYRTIYMHLRDGADHDCDAAWNQTVPSLSGDLLDEYVTHLQETGCPQTPPRNPDAAHWGTNEQTIPVTVGQHVARGEFLAWAGNTGPGGKRGSGGPNTHLHIFWCRRDPTDGRWYFFDPYGVYALPGCYAAGITDSTNGPCVRYPVAWLGGRPQYPGTPTTPFSDKLSSLTRGRLPADPDDRILERERTRLPGDPR